MEERRILDCREEIKEAIRKVKNLHHEIIVIEAAVDISDDECYVSWYIDTVNTEYAKVTLRKNRFFRAFPISKEEFESSTAELIVYTTDRTALINRAFLILAVSSFNKPNAKSIKLFRKYGIPLLEERFFRTKKGEKNREIAH